MLNRSPVQVAALIVGIAFLAGRQNWLKALDQNRNWITKVTCPERFTVAGPPYDDVVPFARAIPGAPCSCGRIDQPRRGAMHFSFLS